MKKRTQKNIKVAMNLILACMLLATGIQPLIAGNISRLDYGFAFTLLILSLVNLHLADMIINTQQKIIKKIRGIEE